MRFTATSGGVPAGFYQAEFVNIEEFTQGRSDYGAAVVLRFTVLGGRFDGQECSRICGAKLTPKAALTKFATALKGGALLANEDFDFSKYYGTKGGIHVSETETGSTKVTTFIRQAEPDRSESALPGVPY